MITSSCINESNSEVGCCESCYHSMVCPSVRLSVTLVRLAKAVTRSEMSSSRDTCLTTSSPSSPAGWKDLGGRTSFKISITNWVHGSACGQTTYTCCNSQLMLSMVPPNKGAILRCSVCIHNMWCFGYIVTEMSGCWLHAASTCWEDSTSERAGSPGITYYERLAVSCLQLFVTQ